MSQRLALISGVILLAGCLGRGALADVPKPAGPATITSDELDVQDNGARSVFTGHVILKQDPYTLQADKMVRSRKSGVVEVYGHVRGFWISDKGEKLVATGERGRYRPGDETIELWDNPKLERWETVADTMPVVITARYFIAYRNERTVWAKRDVHMVQISRAETRSRFARYDQVDQMLHLWGRGGVFIHVEDVKGKADFKSERAQLCLSPKRARLMDHVFGHVIPART